MKCDKKCCCVGKECKKAGLLAAYVRHLLNEKFNLTWVLVLTEVEQRYPTGVKSESKQLQEVYAITWSVLYAGVSDTSGVVSVHIAM